jgi:hypothetical protein
MRKHKIINLKKDRPKSQIFLGIVSLILLAGTVICSVGTSSLGSKLLRLEREIAKIDSENRDLRGQMISESSLNLVSEKAIEEGMVKSGKVIYISKGEFVAKLP